MKSWLLPLLLLAGAVQADEHIAVCYDYGCDTQAEVRFDDVQLAFVRDQLRGARDAAEERAQLALAIGSLYRWAGEQSPIHNDKGGDYNDDGVEGRMDCIDHATTTTRLLRMIESHGWLRHHRVLEPAKRSTFFTQHFSAVIEARMAPVASDRPIDEAANVEYCAGCYDEGGSMMASPHRVASRPRRDNTLPRWAVDTWFRDNGAPAVVMDIETWRRGAYPDD